MVLFSSKKYACETCIKGHRSSACQHTDRPLYEIKKKGRPVTQCSHCRELRKTKQVHVKCICQSKADDGNAAPEGHPGKGKGVSKATEGAVFPNGLPRPLEEAVALQLASEPSSESDHSGDTHACACATTGECNCCKPRKTAARHQQKGSRGSAQGATSSAASSTSSLPLPSQILARIADLRPVLPRPAGNSGPVHSPSSGIAHSTITRHHTYDKTFFSPYGRAYVQVHPSASERSHDQQRRPSPQHSGAQTSQPHFQSALGMSAAPAWITTSAAEEAVYPSMCNCGDSCACPGCAQHNPGATSALPAGSMLIDSCADPMACAHCLDCTLRSLPSVLPPDVTLSPQGNGMDEWGREQQAGWGPGDAAGAIFAQQSGDFRTAPSAADMWPATVQRHETSPPRNEFSPEFASARAGDERPIWGLGAPLPRGQQPCPSDLGASRQGLSRSSSTSSRSSGGSGGQCHHPHQQQQPGSMMVPGFVPFGCEGALGAGADVRNSGSCSPPGGVAPSSALRVQQQQQQPTPSEYEGYPVEAGDFELDIPGIRVQ